MQELVGVEWYDRGLADGNHGDGVSDGIKYFEAVARFLARLSAVMLDYRCDVPAAESVLRQIVFSATRVNSSYFICYFMLSLDCWPS